MPWHSHRDFIPIKSNHTKGLWENHLTSLPLASNWEIRWKSGSCWKQMESQAGLSWEIKLAQRNHSLWFSVIQCSLIIYNVVKHPSQLTDRMLPGWMDDVRWTLLLFGQPDSIPCLLPAGQNLSSWHLWCSGPQGPENQPLGPSGLGNGRPLLSTLSLPLHTISGMILCLVCFCCIIL